LPEKGAGLARTRARDTRPGGHHFLAVALPETVAEPRDNRHLQILRPGAVNFLPALKRKPAARPNFHAASS
jgi:hypothetical protein